MAWHVRRWTDVPTRFRVVKLVRRSSLYLVHQCRLTLPAAHSGASWLPSSGHPLKVYIGMFSVAEIQDAWTRLLSWLSALTLGQIWVRIYNPPTRRNLAIVAVIIVSQIPRWVREWKEWSLSRRVVQFEWALPEVR